MNYTGSPCMKSTLRADESAAMPRMKYRLAAV